MRPIPGQPGGFEDGLLPLRMVNAIREAIRAALNESGLLALTATVNEAR